MEIGKRIRQVREDKYLTQSEFAKKLLIDRGHVSKLETGSAHLTPPLRLAICNVFAVRREWLETGEGQMYDDRWKLLEERSKELGEDIYLELLSGKAAKKAHAELLEKIRYTEEPFPPARISEAEEAPPPHPGRRKEDQLPHLSALVHTLLSLPPKKQKKLMLMILTMVELFAESEIKANEKSAQVA